MDLGLFFGGVRRAHHKNMRVLPLGSFMIFGASPTKTAKLSSALDVNAPAPPSILKPEGLCPAVFNIAFKFAIIAEPKTISVPHAANDVKKPLLMMPQNFAKQRFCETPA